MPHLILTETDARIVGALMRVARAGDTITYGELGAEVGLHQRAFAGPLDRVISFCTEARIPYLNTLVVYARGPLMGRCGPGHGKALPGRDEDADRAECWAFFGPQRDAA